MKSSVRKSRFLSYVLRHAPESIGLTLDAHGWVDIAELVRRAREHDIALSEYEVRHIVARDAKQRYAIDSSGTRIRANYGHSIPIDLDVPPSPPPERLFHGTARDRVECIRAEGIHPQGRRFVHLSEDRRTAVAVGRRHGDPVVLEIDARGLASAGHPFYRSPGGTWLTDVVPPEFVLGEPS